MHKLTTNNWHKDIWEQIKFPAGSTNSLAGSRNGRPAGCPDPYHTTLFLGTSLLGMFIG